MQVEPYKRWVKSFLTKALSCTAKLGAVVDVEKSATHLDAKRAVFKYSIFESFENLGCDPVHSAVCLNPFETNGA